jgi:hypothetical protein
LIGAVAASLVFALGGIPILFATAFSVGHQPNGDILSKLIGLVVLVGVMGGCVWMAWMVRRFVSRP